MPTGIYKRTQLHKDRIGIAGTGKKRNTITKEKIRRSAIGNNNGKGNKGKIWNEKEKKDRSEAQRGEKHWNWQGGISENPYPEDWSDTLRESIRQRDNYICQECGLHQEELKGRFKKLDVHHIDYNKDNLDPNNLTTLCRSCHVKTNYNREYWYKYLKTGEIDSQENR